MRNAVIASTALMGSTTLAAGTAHVVNACKYDVYMANTPASGGGHQAIDKVLSPGGSYSQPWTMLSTNGGWSIKLAKQPEYQDNLLQYEYTYQEDGTIWYDLSQVNGNPWDGDWMITASGDCSPKQVAYRYATDDAYGMQSCPAEAEITVTLCSGEDQADEAVSSAIAKVSSVPAAATSSNEQQAPTTASSEQQVETSAPAAATTTKKGDNNSGNGNGNNHGGWKHGGWHIGPGGIVQAAGAPSPSPTTMVTKKVANVGGYDYTVTDIVTEVVTAYATAGAKRHAHARHPHQKREE